MVAHTSHRVFSWVAPAVANQLTATGRSAKLERMGAYPKIELHRQIRSYMKKNDPQELVGEYVVKLLKSIRKTVENSNLDPERLPRWVDAANIEVGFRERVFVFLIEKSNVESDNVVFRGEFDTDAEFFFPNVDSPSSPPEFVLEPGVRESGMVPGGTSLSSLTVVLDDRMPNVRQVVYGDNNPTTLIHSFLEVNSGDETTALRYIPLALFIHSDEFKSVAESLEEHTRDIVQHLNRIHKSGKGDDFKNERAREKAVIARRENSVIILGNYKGTYKEELKQVRDRVGADGYNANLISDLPEIPDMSTSDKVKSWTATARFCILIDRVGGGENNEFEILKTQEKVLAVLRPQAGGSTSMMGHESLVNRNDIKFFEFEKTPIETVNKAVRWAESIVEKREEAYNEHFSWRNDNE